MTERDKQENEEIYRYRRRLYGKGVNKWLDGFPRAPIVRFMEAGGRGGNVAGFAPTNAYVLEDGVTFYVTEDGVTFYVQEV